MSAEVATVPPFNLEATVLSQYANNATMCALKSAFGQWFDPTADIVGFYETVWDIDQAAGFGLDIWGRILGVSRVIPIPGTSGAFGFWNADTPPDWQNFGGGPFYAGQLSNGSYKLLDPSYKTLLLTKALANICNAVAPALNAIVSNLFPGQGRAYVIDRGNMAMTYVFEFALNPIDYAILAYSGVLPHPAGVLTSIQVITGGNFGFEEAGGLAQPFDYGTFYNGAS